MKNINIQIEDELHTAVKQKALERKISLKQYVTLALKEKTQHHRNAFSGVSLQEDIQ